MAKGAGKKARKRKGAARGGDSRAARLERALAAGLKREAKAASRLEAARLEVAVLRIALAEVLGDEVGPPESSALPAAASAAPAAATRKAAAAEPKAAGARPRAAATRKAAAAKPKAPASTTAAPEPQAGPAGRRRRAPRPAPPEG